MRALATILLATATSAQPRTAADHQIEATRLYEAGRYREAMDEFARAQALAPDEPVYVLSRARCHHKLDELAEAVAHYDRYLAAERKDADGVARARRYRAEAQAALDRRRAEATPPVPARVPVPAPAPAPARVPRPAPVPARTHVSPIAPAFGMDAPSRPTPTRRIVAWTAVGLGAAAAVAGAWFGRVASSKQDEWDDEQARGGVWPDDFRDIESSGDRAERLEIGLLIGGGVALAAGAILLWTGGGDATESAAGPATVRF